MSNFKNLRGSARRDGSKSVRVATHSRILRFLLDRANRHVTVLEHGMGISSTRLLHDHSSVDSFVSFEDDPRWAVCAGCRGNHKIEKYSDELAVDIIDRIKPYLSFVDGPGDQRAGVFEASINAGVDVIVEHDSETHDEKDVSFRKSLLEKHGYSGFVYAGQNPETAVYVKNVSLVGDFNEPLIPY